MPFISYLKYTSSEKEKSLKSDCMYYSSTNMDVVSVIISHKDGGNGPKNTEHFRIFSKNASTDGQISAHGKASIAEHSFDFKQTLSGDIS